MQRISKEKANIVAKTPLTICIRYSGARFIISWSGTYRVYSAVVFPPNILGNPTAQFPPSRQVLIK